MIEVKPIKTANTAAQVKTESPKKEKATITFQEWWSGEKSLTSTAARRVGWENLADWLEDKDKVCTDGKDDGKLGFGETMKSFGKGLAGLVKGAINHPIVTAAAIGVGAATVALTGGAILPVMVAAGATIGAGMIGVGAYKAATADTDAEAKQAWESIGTGVFAVGASALGVKSVNNIGAKAGIQSLKDLNNASWGKNITAMFKAIPEAVKQSCLNAKGNALTFFSTIQGDKILYANSNELRAQTHDVTLMNQAHPEAGVENSKYIQLPEGTKINTGYGTKVIEKNDLVFIDRNGNYSVSKPNYNFYHNEHFTEYTMDGDIIINDKGNVLVKGAKQAFEAHQQAKIAESIQLDNNLSKYGVEFVRREPRTLLLDDIVIRTNGKEVVLKSNWYYSDNDSYKQIILEALTKGEKDLSNILL